VSALSSKPQKSGAEARTWLLGENSEGLLEGDVDLEGYSRQASVVMVVVVAAGAG
jgi:hypothetical protein